MKPERWTIVSERNVFAHVASLDFALDNCAVVIHHAGGCMDVPGVCQARCKDLQGGFSEPMSLADEKFSAMKKEKEEEEDKEKDKEKKEEEEEKKEKEETSKKLIFFSKQKMEVSNAHKIYHFQLTFIVSTAIELGGGNEKLRQ
ncbi:hypothetical protein E5288_WYG008942 [Bos mutus]|uniref:Uncharacterized protein n=1 Tax=Bos mutus TaxID=72004 RepID=A0A6B0QYF8_9CETA|nr:hypothetical protein [Bos mutus]